MISNLKFFKLAIAILFIYAIIHISCTEKDNKSKLIKHPNISGIYPHLAFYNNQGECGTGALVPWADRLWAISYSPHMPNGSDDKLYEIDENLNVIIRPESIGGTPANRMIHRESEQLFIGPYAIDQDRNVRAIPYGQMLGRHTGNARHLSDPQNMIYYASMEEGFYEVNVHDLSVNTLYEDGYNFQKEGDMSQYAPLLPGAHGKGLYSGQGVLVYSNNGEASQEALTQFDIESGVLAEWDGRDWNIVRRNQFVEVTGPGGIYGNSNPETDPIWVTGWDHKSLLVGVRDYEKGWSFFRLPKASHSYDGAHGWNTEWPRIRNIGSDQNDDYLMTMHGMFWRFPGTFTADNPMGIRPRSAYLKVIGDFTRWKDQLVFGCDDSAQREFLNKRSVKGGIEGPGQSNSNLWFASLTKPDELGPSINAGAVWLEEDVDADVYSEPFLFNGWESRNLWLKNHSDVDIQFNIETFENDTWNDAKVIKIAGGTDEFIQLKDETNGEWIRAKLDKKAKVTLAFTYENKDNRSTSHDSIFNGLADVSNEQTFGGLLYGLGENRRKLGVSSRNGQGVLGGYYELDSTLNLRKRNDPETQFFIEEKFAIPMNVVTIDKASVLIVDDSGRRWRLPKGNDRFDELTNKAQLRISREVATERDLFNCHGTFYELPAENADGFAKIRPIASHNFRIHDYASYRGLLVMTGIEPNIKPNEHIITSEDANAAVWVGVIDDLWRLGKPTGYGGPWKDSRVEASIPSDPFLIGFYDHKTLDINHNSDEKIQFTLEVNPLGHGPWFTYKKFEVAPGKKLHYEFPTGFQVRWIRIVADKTCEATSLFTYD